MNALELEQQVQTLPPAELARFGQWFDAYRERALSRAPEADPSLEQEAELARRLALAREHPELLEPWEGTVEKLRRELDAYCAQKAARRAP